MQNSKWIANVLRALDEASRPEEMNLPGFRFHALVGPNKGRHAVNAGGNWRIAFGRTEGDAIDVDLEDYHRGHAPGSSRNAACRPCIPANFCARRSCLRSVAEDGDRKLLGVSRQTLYEILEEKQPVTPVMALRLGKLCGNGPDLWLNLQKR